MSVPKHDQSGEDYQLLKAAIAEVERYRSMDRLIHLCTMSLLLLHWR